MEGTQASNWSHAMYSSVTADRRRLINKTLAARLFAEAEGRCTYCTLPIGATVIRRDKLVSLNRAWDHFVPFSFIGRHNRTNWRLACHVCNQIKSDDRFDTEDDARQVILRRREELGYESVSASWTRLEDEPYWKRPDAAGQALTDDGPFKENDQVRPRPKGNIHVVARADEMGRRIQQVLVACGKSWPSSSLEPADGYHAPHCRACSNASLSTTVGMSEEQR